MRVVTGTVVSGRVVLDDAGFVDGTHVVVLSCDKEDKTSLLADELAELEAGIAGGCKKFCVNGHKAGDCCL